MVKQFFTRLKEYYLRVTNVLCDWEEQSFRSIFSNAPDAILLIGTDGYIRDVNPKACQVYDYAYEEFIGKHGSEFVHSDNKQIFVKALAATQSGKSYSSESVDLRSDGSPFPIEVHITPFTYHGEPVMLCFIRDITERKQLEEVQQFTQFAIDHASNAAYWMNSDASFFYVNHAACCSLGYSQEELLSMSVYEIDAEFNANNWPELWYKIKQEKNFTIESRHIKKDGTVFPVEITVNYLEYEGKEYNCAFASDITERKRTEDHILKLAFNDPLTQLSNRRLLTDRLSQAMAASNRNGCYGALLFLDLDNFKPLNDKYGHGVGDMLLVEVADRLKTCVREMDTVSRFGGDEFIVMINKLTADKAESIAEARIIADKIRISLGTNYMLTPKTRNGADSVINHNCTVSIGVVLFINSDTSPEDIIKWADLAMYQAKGAGRNQISFYEGDAE